MFQHFFGVLIFPTNQNPQMTTSTRESGRHLTELAAGQVIANILALHVHVGRLNLVGVTDVFEDSSVPTVTEEDVNLANASGELSFKCHVVKCRCE